ncbi:MAG: hypothetical protein CVV24_05305 [Ignavibacteriae bacterium HGW-Ignavibacteriae-3]|nr:MAG: hypothetical protein CVV24_05305 [Ignavibacteriae bacterium HGW-Ignavibacteriae-3]
MWLFLNGSILPQEEILISPFDRGFQFSDGVYEVIRYYPRRFFRLENHIERLIYSLNETHIPVPDLKNIENILNELIIKNDLTHELSIAYIQISRGYQYPRRHSYVENLDPTFFISVEKMPVKKNEMINGIKAGLEEDLRWHRCDIKSTSLLPNVLSAGDAARKGYSEIVYHRNGIITEGSHTNICFVKDNVLITPPLSNLILAGVTRKTVLEICCSIGIKVEEKNVNVEELSDFDEILLLGTTTEITPVIELDGTKVNDGHPGPVCRILQGEYQKLIFSK